MPPYWTFVLTGDFQRGSDVWCILYVRWYDHRSWERHLVRWHVRRHVLAGKSGSVDVAVGTVIGGVGRPAPVPSAHFSCPTVPS